MEFGDKTLHREGTGETKGMKEPRKFEKRKMTM